MQHNRRNTCNSYKTSIKGILIRKSQALSIGEKLDVR